MAGSSAPLPPEVVPADVALLCRRLREAGHAAYVVGGAVRDALCGRTPHEFDVASSATPDEVTAIFGRQRTLPIGVKHGTVTVLWGYGDARRAIEVTTFRGEGAYLDGRRPSSVTFLDDVRDDLARRDFTMNAMAWDPVDGLLVDPWGGAADLERRVIRAVGDPLARLREDGLRCLRAVRFAAVLGMTVDGPTRDAIPLTLDVFRKVSAERVREELNRLLLAPRPSIGLELMRDTGLMAAVIPELLAGVGLTQNRFHRHDVWEHTLATVDAAPPRLPIRWATLLHDVGKARTAEEREDLPGERSFHRHEQVGAGIADAVLRRLKFSNEDRALVVHLVAQHMYYYTDEWTPQAVRRFLRRVGPEHVEDLFALRAADIRGSGRDQDPEEEIGPVRVRVAEALRAAAALRVSDLAIDGADVMRVLGVGPGPEVGRVLGRLLERVLDDPALNTRETLLKFVEGEIPQP